jgi:hypothetical protein
MLKVSYPDQSQFEPDYINKLNSHLSKLPNRVFKYFKDHYLLKPYRDFLKQIDSKYADVKHDKLLVKEIVIAPISELVILNQKFEGVFSKKICKLVHKKNKKGKSVKFHKEYSDYCKDLLGIFNYKDKQPIISDFFMEYYEKMNISTCYFCNINFVNVFSLFGEYLNEEDLIRNISPQELKNLGLKNDDLDNAIISLKGVKKISNIPDDSLKKTFENLFKHLSNDSGSIGNVLKNKYRNHYTLDHALDKAKYPLTSLSLYNFVPSCYSCNSKFKGSESIIGNNYRSDLSPTSDDFNFQNDVKFLMLSKKGDSINDIKCLDDLVLKFDYLNSPDDYKNYIDVFRLKQRYDHHKHIALDIVEKSVRYSQSNIDQISKELNIPSETIKKDIYGEELFNGDIQASPFTKLKRDIAISCEIEGVKTI